MRVQDYIFAVAPLLEDALMDRDLVHRQTAAAVVQHISLGVAVSAVFMLVVTCLWL
jgi:splicing factor 3B subunit 1